MHVSTITKPVAHSISAIQALDLDSVKSRVMDAELGEGWTAEYADSVATAYRTWLTMLVKHPDESEDIMLSKDVDEFWHTHILQTLKYTEDCEQVFGFYLHHFPHVGERTAADLEHREKLAAKTRALYESEFGSAQDATSAWAGAAAPAIRAAQAAFSTGPGIRTEHAAFSTGPDIRAENAAFSTNPGIRAAKAAFSTGPGIRAENAAFSTGPGIRAENAAFSTGPGIQRLDGVRAGKAEQAATA